MQNPFESLFTTLWCTINVLNMGSKKDSQFTHHAMYHPLKIAFLQYDDSGTLWQCPHLYTS